MQKLVVYKGFDEDSCLHLTHHCSLADAQVTFGQALAHLLHDHFIYSAFGSLYLLYSPAAHRQPEKMR